MLQRGDQETPGKTGRVGRYELLTFTGKQLFRPSLLLLLLVAVCWAEKCSATGAKTSSYRTCVTFRAKVVCRKCCRMLITRLL